MAYRVRRRRCRKNGMTLGRFQSVGIRQLTLTMAFGAAEKFRAQTDRRISAEGHLADGRSDGLPGRRRGALRLRRRRDVLLGVCKPMVRGRLWRELHRLRIGAGACSGLATVGSRMPVIRRGRMIGLRLRRQGDFVHPAGTGCLVTVRRLRLRHRCRHPLRLHGGRDRIARSVEDQGQAEQYPEQDAIHGRRTLTPAAAMHANGR